MLKRQKSHEESTAFLITENLPSRKSSFKSKMFKISYKTDANGVSFFSGAIEIFSFFSESKIERRRNFFTEFSFSSKNSTEAILFFSQRIFSKTTEISSSSLKSFFQTLFSIFSDKPE